MSGMSIEKRHEIKFSVECNELLDLLAEISQAPSEALYGFAGLAEKRSGFVNVEISELPAGRANHLAVALKPSDSLRDIVSTVRAFKADRFAREQIRH